MDMFKQTQQLKQGFNILPQQIQMLGIYHLNILDLEQRIKDELNENPLLENRQETEGDDAGLSNSDETAGFQNWEEYGYDDIPNYCIENHCYIHNNPINQPIREKIDFRDLLKQQLINLNLSEGDYSLACFILDCVSDTGYLERTSAEVADDYSFMAGMLAKETKVDSLLKQIQYLEPAGIGCQNIQEFLILQLTEQKSSPIIRKSIALLTNHYDDLKNQHFKTICSKLKIDEEELSIILKQVSKLQLNPVNITHEDQPLKNTIIPDFILITEGQLLTAELYKPKSDTLFINPDLARRIEDTDVKSAGGKSNALYLKNKYTSAKWFVDAIQTREKNMLHIMREILKIQQQYFLSGEIEDLKPMILKTIAEKVGLDIATVSRVTCNKYIETPFGIILLKDLFTQAIETEDGLSMSNRVVQLTLKKIIDDEDAENPYNDKQLVTLLAENGIRIARRTVSKYREQLHIPVGNMRRLWSKVS